MPLSLTTIGFPRRSLAVGTSTRTQPSVTLYSWTLVFFNAVESNTDVAQKHFLVVEGASRIDGEVIRWNLWVRVLGHDGFH